MMYFYIPRKWLLLKNNVIPNYGFKRAIDQASNITLCHQHSSNVAQQPQTNSYSIRQHMHTQSFQFRMSK